ncbi:thermonuclease family protein [Tabrizicola oligotrophica]|uniref:Thermonuclease family protein n=1 Tax=Tabrizicola oligotrophica TaxID=2710650 RepID=A0A6M0QZX0_9RHOB|nr:hypothetical protein [Tabrizicola oligotrophica]NEY92152.1 hypothetical protein [Tabrizicola oligotrophica]
MTKRPTRDDWNRMKAERRARVSGTPNRAFRQRRPRETDPGAIFFRGLVLVGLLGFSVFEATERFPEYLGPVVAATSLQTMKGEVSHVRDGDTIEVNGVPIRFGSLDCAERDTQEGQRATARMRSLISGETLTCHLNGRSSYDRKIGSCQLSDGRDLAAAMMAERLCDRFW